MFSAADWGKVLTPDTPLLEIVVRGTLMYLGIFTLMRVVLKRQTGGVGMSDLLVTVLLSDAAQNGMADDYHSVSDGLLLVATIMAWSHAIDWLGHRFPRFQRLMYPPPLLLVRNGVLMRRNMRREFLTEEELMSQLRQQGVSDVTEVKEAFMEGDGNISVLQKKR